MNQWRSKGHFYGITLAMALIGVIGWLSLAEKRDLKTADVASQARVNESFGKLPLIFEPNSGQADSPVKFISRNRGYSLFLTDNEALLATEKSSLVRMQMLGANRPKVSGVDELQSRSNYFVGTDREEWKIDIPNYSKVRYENLYDGIDMVYYGNQRNLEYDFVLSPGADPDLITLNFDGVEDLRIDERGDLLLKTGSEEIRQQKPVVYQELAGLREPIEGRYIFKGDRRIGFEIAEYDRNRTLVIDPIMNYSTYVGGSGTDEALDIITDSSGNLYVTGRTISPNLQVKNSLQSTLGGGFDAFVMKLNAAGNSVIYNTYLGGSGEEFSAGIAVDSAGSVYIVGDTASPNFPTVSALKSSLGGTQDAFISKLNPEGNRLVYSTYIGGARSEAANSVVVDSGGNAYVAGLTISTDFPTASAFQSTAGGSFDAFILKLNPAGNSLLYSTYLGGSNNDIGIGLAIDSAGNAYVTGSTISTNFPTSRALQAALGGGEPFGDAFITKINPSGNALVYSTYLGGSASDFGTRIEVDSAGNAYVTGGTLSQNFPTARAFQSTFGGGAELGDAFVAKLSPAGDNWIFSTFLGGEGDDFGSSIALDTGGNIYITGSAASANFPTSNTLQSSFGGGETDAFVTVLNPSGGATLYSTFLGGNGEDRGSSITIDSSGSAYVAGSTASGNFPMLNALQSANGGAKDIFLTKITESSIPTGDFQITITPASQSVSPGASTSFTIGATASNGFSQAINLTAAISPANSNLQTSFSSPALTPGGTSTLTVNTTSQAQPGTFNITVTGTSGQIVRTMTATVNLISQPDFSLTFNPSTLNVTRGQKGQINVGVNRVGGFTGSVTIEAPNTKAIKVKLTPPSQATTGTSASFNFTIKKKAARGTQQLTFTARDSSGRVRTGTLTLVIQ